MLTETVQHKYLGDVPEGDVYFIKDYPPQLHSVENAVRFHREYADPSMYNNLSGRIIAHFNLDMSTKKQVC